MFLCSANTAYRAPAWYVCATMSDECWGLKLHEGAEGGVLQNEQTF